MSSDPNGLRWSTSDKNYGKALLKKSGWEEGRGLGKEQDGSALPVKVSRKDDVMGLGYSSGVQDTWTTQSVGFADVLDRIKKTSSSSTTIVMVNHSDDDDDGEAVSSPTSSPTSSGHSVSRHYKMYAKRNALKTELLRSSGDGKSEEILGAASSRKRGRTNNGGSDDDGEGRSTESTLQSPVLKRLMGRCIKEEPTKTNEDDDQNRVKITKPEPRPPRCTQSPFVMAQ